MNSVQCVLGAVSRFTLLSLTCLFCLLAHVLAQQGKPDFSGTWKLDLSKSKLGAQRPRESDEYRIEHKDPLLMMVHTFVDHSDTYRYVTDGKERVANSSALDGVTYAKAKWQGNVLVIEKRQEVGGKHSTWTMKYALSQDGKSLAIIEHFKKSLFGAAFDDLLTYDKKK